MSNPSQKQLERHKSSLKIRRFKIWPDKPPRERPGEIVRPEIYYYPPKVAKKGSKRKSRFSKPSIIVVPGGYTRKQHIEAETDNAGTVFSYQGYPTYVINYRTFPNVWPVPYLDTSAAIDVIYHMTRPQDLGIIAFGHGSHLAAIEQYNNPSRFAFWSCVYPCVLYNDKYQSDEFVEYLSTCAGADTKYTKDGRKFINKHTPPCFLTHAGDDSVSMYENSIYLQQSMKDCKVPCELVHFNRGGHSFGVQFTHGTSYSWWRQFLQWLEDLYESD